MAQNNTRSLLTGILQGFGGNLQKRQDKNMEFNDALGKMILEAKIKSELNPSEYKPTTREDAISFEQLIHPERGAMANAMKGGDSGELVYRDPATGNAVDSTQAIADIEQGKQYIINRKQPTRYGVTEQTVSKPEDLTETEKNYITTSGRVKSSLEALQNDVYPRLNDPKYNKDWAAMQAQNFPFWAIKDQNIQDFKSALTQLKSDIPFLRGGKQLTATEAKRVDILLNPFGKSDETKMKDIARFQKEFMGGEKLMRGGIRELNTRTMSTPKTVGDMVGGEIKKPTRSGGKRMKDAQGNEAIVYPDGSFEEL